MLEEVGKVLWIMDLMDKISCRMEEDVVKEMVREGESEPFKVGGAGYSGADQPQARKASAALHLSP
jgi:hypothetical protein